MEQTEKILGLTKSYETKIDFLSKSYTKALLDNDNSVNYSHITIQLEMYKRFIKELKTIIE